MAIIFPSGITLSSLEVKILQDMFVDAAEFEAHIENFVHHKMEQRADKLFREWLPKLIDDPNYTTIPATKAELLQTIFDHPDYLTRAERDAIPGPV